jgi:hypothetical protein
MTSPSTASSRWERARSDLIGSHRFGRLTPLGHSVAARVCVGYVRLTIEGWFTDRVVDDCHEAYRDEKSVAGRTPRAQRKGCFYIKRLVMLLALVALAVPAIASAAIPSDAATCTPTGFVRDGINLTAKKIGGNVTGPLNAAGCDIGVFYGPGSIGSVTKATMAAGDTTGATNTLLDNELNLCVVPR